MLAGDGRFVPETRSLSAAGRASIDPATKVGKPSSTTTLFPPNKTTLQLPPRRVPGVPRHVWIKEPQKEGATIV